MGFILYIHHHHVQFNSTIILSLLKFQVIATAVCVKLIETFMPMSSQMNNLKKILQLVVDYYNEVGFSY